MRIMEQPLLIALGFTWALFLHCNDVAAQVRFPEPTGAFAIGRIDLDLLDTAREEIFTDEPGDKRRLLITLYYPAAVPAGATHSSFTSAALAIAMELDEEEQARLSAGYEGFPVQEGTYPVLLFSPGLGNLPMYYSSLMYEMASHGYVVAVLSHPFSTSFTAFPDGTVLRHNDAGGVNAETLEGQLAELEHLGVTWVQDIRFVLDQLTAWNENDALLQGHLDLERVGAFGHSFGGAAAVQAAYEDERIDAAINMDGTMFGAVATMGSRVPFLFLGSYTPPPTDQQIIDMGISREQFDAEEKILADALAATLSRSQDATSHELTNGRHNAFWTDQLFFAAAWTPEQLVERLGDIEPEATFGQISGWIRDFMALHVSRQ